MKLLAFAILFGVLMTTARAGFSALFSSSERSDSDIDSDSDDDKLAAFIKCLLDKGDCTTEGEKAKSMWSHLIETNCEECDEKQKQMARKVKDLLNEDPELLDEIKQKYDPDNSHLENYQSFLEGS